MWMYLQWKVMERDLTVAASSQALSLVLIGSGVIWHSRYPAATQTYRESFKFCVAYKPSNVKDH